MQSGCPEHSAPGLGERGLGKQGSWKNTVVGAQAVLGSFNKDESEAQQPVMPPGTAAYKGPSPQKRERREGARLEEAEVSCHAFRSKATATLLKRSGSRYFKWAASSGVSSPSSASEEDLYTFVGSLRAEGGRNGCQPLRGGIEVPARGCWSAPHAPREGPLLQGFGRRKGHLPE